MSVKFLAFSMLKTVKLVTSVPDLWCSTCFLIKLDECLWSKKTWCILVAYFSSRCRQPKSCSHLEIENKKNQRQTNGRRKSERRRDHEWIELCRHTNLKMHSSNELRFACIWSHRLGRQATALLFLDACYYLIVSWKPDYCFVPPECNVVGSRSAIEYGNVQICLIGLDGEIQLF